MTSSFPNGFLDELKAKNDIVSVVSRYVTLERKGRTYWGRCPFHGEKTPSFAVNENDQFYHCFGCHVGGDVVKFVQEIESLDFMDAINLLAEWAHMEVPKLNQSDNIAIEKKKQQKERLQNLMRDAAVYYNKNMAQDVAKPAKDYLIKRQVNSALATKFGLGYSLGYNEVIEHLSKLGYSLDEMLTAGVVKTNSAGKYYDAVAGRLVFPVVDIYGKVIAFCGRSLEQNVSFAKYLNTAETPIFSKGKTLFGINLVKKKKQTEPVNYLIVVEGHMDVVSLHKAGFDVAVASMGTALTEDQAKLIKRMADKVFICYDGDSAGKKATLRGLDILRKHGLDVKVVSLPEGMDPDDVINKYGEAGYQKCLDRALPLVEFKLRYLQKLYDMSSHDGKAKYLEDAISVLKDLSEVECEVYIDLVSQLCDCNKDFIRRHLSGSKSESFQGNSKIKVIPVEAEKVIDSGLVKAEKTILSCMVHAKPFVKADVNLSQLFTEARREFYDFLYNALQSTVDGKSLVQDFYNEFSAEYSDAASEIVNYLLESNLEEFDGVAYKDSVWKLVETHYKKKIEALNAKIQESSDMSERRQLASEVKTIIEKIRNKKVEIL